MALLCLLHEIVPQAAAIGLLVDPNNTNSEIESATVQAAGSGLGVQSISWKQPTTRRSTRHSPSWPRTKPALHQCGSYVGRILKGESAAELPVVQPTKIRASSQSEGREDTRLTRATDAPCRRGRRDRIAGMSARGASLPSMMSARMPDIGG